MLEVARVQIAPNEVVLSGEVSDIFDFLDNNGGLTEEFLYQHQPITDDVVNVYATNKKPIGRLDRVLAKNNHLVILQGPVIVVARKGYAGRLFVVDDESLIIQEDAYAIVPKAQYLDSISLEWFAGHYSEEFQALRTSDDGIGDFPRALLRRRRVNFPPRDTQDRLAFLYARRDSLVQKLKTLNDEAQKLILSAGA